MSREPATLAARPAVRPTIRTDDLDRDEHRPRRKLESEPGWSSSPRAGHSSSPPADELMSDRPPSGSTNRRIEAFGSWKNTIGPWYGPSEQSTSRPAARPSSRGRAGSGTRASPSTRPGTPPASAESPSAIRSAGTNGSGSRPRPSGRGPNGPGAGLYTNIRRPSASSCIPYEMGRDEERLRRRPRVRAPNSTPPLVSLGSGTGSLPLVLVRRQSDGLAEEVRRTSMPCPLRRSRAGFRDASGPSPGDATRRRPARMPRSPGRSPRRSTGRPCQTLSSRAARDRKAGSSRHASASGSYAAAIAVWVLRHGCCRRALRRTRSSRRRSTPPSRP